MWKECTRNHLEFLSLFFNILFSFCLSFISTANDDEYLTFAEILEPDNQSLVNNVNNLVRFRPTDSGRLFLCNCKIVLRLHTREARRCILQPSPISRRKYPATMFFLCITHKFTQYKYESRDWPMAQIGQSVIYLLLDRNIIWVF